MQLGPDSEFQSNDCLQCYLYICVQYLETKFNKETYMNGHNFNIHTVATITQCMDH